MIEPRNSAKVPRMTTAARLTTVRPCRGRAGTDPLAGTRNWIRAHVSGGEGADVGRDTGAEPLMVSTAAEINDLLTEPA